MVCYRKTEAKRFLRATPVGDAAPRSSAPFPRPTQAKVSHLEPRGPDHARVLRVVTPLPEGCADPLLRLQEAQAEVVLAEEGQGVPAQVPAHGEHLEVTWRKPGG